MTHKQGYRSVISDWFSAEHASFWNSVPKWKKLQDSIPWDAQMDWFGIPAPGRTSLGAYSGSIDFCYQQLTYLDAHMMKVRNGSQIYVFTFTQRNPSMSINYSRSNSCDEHEFNSNETIQESKEWDSNGTTSKYTLFKKKYRIPMLSCVMPHSSWFH